MLIALNSTGLKINIYIKNKGYKTKILFNNSNFMLTDKACLWVLNCYLKHEYDTVWGLWGCSAILYSNCGHLLYSAQWQPLAFSWKQIHYYILSIPSFSSAENYLDSRQLYTQIQMWTRIAGQDTTQWSSWWSRIFF